MSVLETLSDGGNEWLEQLGLLDLLEEAKGRASDVLVGVLQVISDGVADRTDDKSGCEGTKRKSRWKGNGKDSPNKNHLLLEVALVVQLGANLPVEVEHLLELLVPAGHDILNDGHEERWLRAAVEGGYDDTSEGLELDFIAALLEVETKVLGGQLDTIVAQIGCNDGVGNGFGRCHVCEAMWSPAAACWRERSAGK